MPPRYLHPIHSIEGSSDAEPEKDALHISKHGTLPPNTRDARRNSSSRPSRSSSRVEKTKPKAEPATRNILHAIPKEPPPSAKHAEKHSDIPQAREPSQPPRTVKQTKPLKIEKQPPPPEDAPHALSRAVYALESASAHQLSQLRRLEARRALLRKDLARAHSALEMITGSLSSLERSHALALGDLSRARAEQAALEADKAELEELLECERREKERAVRGLRDKSHEAYVYRCAIAAVFKLPGTVREMATMRDVVGLVHEQVTRRGLRMGGKGVEDDEDGGDEGSDEDDEDPLAVVLAGSGRGDSCELGKDV